MATYNASLLRLAREQEGLTQKGLAEKLKVKQAVLSKYENGAIVPPEAMQRKIADALYYPVAFFLQDAEEISYGLAFTGSAVRFHERYPWINMEGQSLMTPTVS